MKQPEALRLAEQFESLPSLLAGGSRHTEAAAELRRLHEANQAMMEALKLAVTLVHVDAIRVRDSEKDKLIDALEQWNEAISKGEQA